MASLLRDVLDFLTDANLVNDSGGWQGFASYMPPSPDKAVAIYETPGLEPEAAKDGTGEVEYDLVGIQVRIRGEPFGYEPARARLGEIYRALHKSQLAPATGDPQYVYVYATQSGPMPMGLDENERPELTWNFRAMRERES